MRYNIGQTIMAVHFNLGHKDQFFNVFYQNPLFWLDMMNVEKITFMELTVKEHHRVAWDHDPEGAEPKYDGFILHCPEGKDYFNQYPRATYGQLDDTQNGAFRKNLPDNYKLADVEASTAPLEYFDLARFMGGLERMVRETKIDVKDLTKIKQAMIYSKAKQLYKDLVDKLKKEHNISVVVKPIWPKAPHITEVILVPQQVVAA